MPRDVEIIKKEVVVLGGDDQGPPVEDDDYLHFFDEGGSSHRIKLNRKSAVELIKNNPGKAVQLNYGSYMNNEFIHNVELVKTPPAVKPPTDSTPPKAEQPPPNPQAVGMITKDLSDHIRAGTLSQVFGKKIAIELTKWYRGQVLAITRITYDGKDLPNIGVKDD